MSAYKKTHRTKPWDQGMHLLLLQYPLMGSPIGVAVMKWQ
jgi:hypothetical protein